MDVSGATNPALKFSFRFRAAAWRCRKAAKRVDAAEGGTKFPVNSAAMGKLAPVVFDWESGPLWHENMRDDRCL